MKWKIPVLALFLLEMRYGSTDDTARHAMRFLDARWGL
jgi:hypothetical protein